MVLEWRFGLPDGIKFALERRFGQLNGIKLASEGRFGRLGRASCPWNDVLLYLERRFGRPDGAMLAPQVPQVAPSCKIFFSLVASVRKFMDTCMY